MQFGDGHYAPRAWWLIPARTATADIEWLAFRCSQHREPIPCSHPPESTVTSAGSSRRSWSKKVPRLRRLCRHFFLRSLPSKVSTMLMATVRSCLGQPLAKPLQVRVANGGWPVKDVTVQFAFDKPNTSGRFTSGNPSPSAFIAVTVTTDKDGIAKCTWTLPSNWTPVSPTVPPSSPPPAYTVIATVVEPALQDSGGNSIYMPVIFSAEWNTADQVAFFPSGCITSAPAPRRSRRSDTLCPPCPYLRRRRRPKRPPRQAASSAVAGLRCHWLLTRYRRQSNRYVRSRSSVHRSVVGHTRRHRNVRLNPDSNRRQWHRQLLLDSR